MLNYREGVLFIRNQFSDPAGILQFLEVHGVTVNRIVVAWDCSLGLATGLPFRREQLWAFEECGLLR